MKAITASKLNLNDRVVLEEVIPLTTPFLLYVDPSSSCNFRCQFCPTGHRDLVQGSEYKRSVMSMKLFEKVIDGLAAFPEPLKVMRMNKIGEPLLNKRLPDMIALAKASGRVNYIDLATNGSMFSPELLIRLTKAGLNRLNISLEGVNRNQYAEHAKVDFDFDLLVENIRWFYDHRGTCEITIKVPGNYLSEHDRQRFLDLFGDYCDRIFIEELAPIWPEFNVEQRSGVTVRTDQSQYRQRLKAKEICTYIFYAMAVNADGSVSACCPDWNQKLIIGNLHQQELHEIWNGKPLRQLQLLHLNGKRHDNPVCGTCGHIRYAQVDNIDDARTVLLQRLINSDTQKKIGN